MKIILKRFEAVKKYDNFDVVGHLDFVKRYYPNENKDLKYDDYAGIIDEIYETLIKKGKGIEINSSGIKYGMNCVHPNEEFLQRYYDLGGKIITIGSDAHETKNIGLYFREIIEILKKIGFKNIARYKNRNLEFMDIEDFFYAKEKGGKGNLFKYIYLSKIF